MLINRTYRTWAIDYPKYYSRVNEAGGGTISPSLLCPNNITNLISSISNNGDFVTSAFLTVNINSTLGDNTNYIQIHSGDLNGLSYDSSNPFYGNLVDINTNVVANGFINLPINGSQYYIRRYLGPANQGCSSALRCPIVSDNLGNFVQAGFVVVETSVSLGFIKVYTLQ